jgi:hypothetical protein
MAERRANSQISSTAKVFSELNDIWYSSTRRAMVSYIHTYIDTSEQLLRDTVEIQKHAAGWAQNTPWARLVDEGRQITTDDVLARSGDVARRLVQVESQTEVEKRM